VVLIPKPGRSLNEAPAFPWRAVELKNPGRVLSSSFHSQTSSALLLLCNSSELRVHQKRFRRGNQ